MEYDRTIWRCKGIRRIMAEEWGEWRHYMRWAFGKWAVRGGWLPPRPPRPPWLWMPRLAKQGARYPRRVFIDMEIVWEIITFMQNTSYRVYGSPCQVISALDQQFFGPMWGVHDSIYSRAKSLMWDTSNAKVSEADLAIGTFWEHVRGCKQELSCSISIEVNRETDVKFNQFQLLILARGGLNFRSLSTSSSH
jgi:hypothetical protein